MRSTGTGPVNRTLATTSRWLGHGARVCVLVSLLVMAGCEVTQHVVGWYVTRRLDRYVDFTSEQKEAARARVDARITELRRTELPAWVSFLRQVRQAVHVGLTEDSVAHLQRAYEARMDAAVAKLTPDLASMLVGLSPAQVDHLTSRLRENVDESFEDLSLPLAERRQKTEKRAIESLEDFVGDLSDSQKEAVRGIMRGLPDDAPERHRAALGQVAHLRAFLATRPTEARIDAELSSMWEHRDDALGPTRDRATREAEARRAIVSVDHLLGAEQRTHAEEEITKRIRKLKRFESTNAPPSSTSG